MKPIFPGLAVSLLLVILLAACNLPQGGVTGPDSGTVATKVALTLAALTQIAPQMSITSPASPTSDQPTNTQIPTETTGPTNTPNSAPGTIAGGISGYPYGSVPGLAIVAYGQEPPYYYSYLITGAGETNFAMSSSYLIPGHFQVVAYDSSGHAGGCTVYVLVISNQTVNCDITNWGGGYPAKPSGVPSP
ncbi:MAG: hypothetical protein NTW99_09080 [Chloroflexi bacterium]|nr:hypothetical protein [Chloroflexota bacterium]